MLGDCKSCLLLIWMMLAGLMASAIYTHDQMYGSKTFTLNDPGLIVLGSAFAMSSMLVFAAGIIFLST
uniref:Uncharacterized protein n=1 Tax=viral metagenome TaxID=1070528 RepID=A0A6C0CI92_9ZZZZ